LNTKPATKAICPFCKVTAGLFTALGVVLLVFPGALFGLLNAAGPDATLTVRWLGALVLAYGVGLAFVLANPARHWPLLLSGFIATLLVILSTLPALHAGSIDPATGWFAVVAGLIGALATGGILLRVASSPAGGEPVPVLPDDLNLDQYRTQDGRSLDALSRENPVLLVLLRHLGCTFCRETLADIAAQRHAIEAAGARVVFVHMGDESKSHYLFARYHLEDVPRISDPEARLYQALRLKRASLLEVYGPAMWRYALQSILLDGHGMGQLVGDRFQMPGAFLVQDGTVVSGFRHQLISDHPDYLSIVRCISSGDQVNY
jgi:hypothetical protein